MKDNWFYVMFSIIILFGFYLYFLAKNRIDKQIAEMKESENKNTLIYKMNNSAYKVYILRAEKWENERGDIIIFDDKDNAGGIIICLY